MGYGGPVLAERFIKIQRMPFITPEILASPAHAMPIEVINAMDRWAWDRVRTAKRVRITDPEGTDLSFTNHDEYWDAKREFYDPELTAATWTRQRAFRQDLSARPHHGPAVDVPSHQGGRMRRHRRHDQSHRTRATGRSSSSRTRRSRRSTPAALFGDKLREVMELTKDLQYPGVPRQGDHVLVGGLDRHQPAHPSPAQGFPVRLRQLPL